jgi:hypothetical protein
MAAVGIALALAGGAGSLAGCSGASVPDTLSTRRQVYEPLTAGDTQDDVRRKWGEPTRVLRYHDPVTGADEEIWQYEPPAWQFHNVLPVTAPATAQRVTFHEGRIARVEAHEINKPMPEILRPDSVSRRNME